MLIWLEQNLATIIVGAILAAVIIAIVVVMIKNKKQGKSSCSCGCGGCPMSSQCHKDKK